MHQHPKAIHPDAIHPDAYLPAHQRLRRSATTAQERNNSSATAAFAWMESLMEQIQPLMAPPALMVVQGEQVIVDTADFRLPAGSEAVVLQHDGTLAIERAEYQPPREEAPFYETETRRGLGAIRQHPEIKLARVRPGVTILGRVIARATAKQLAA